MKSMKKDLEGRKMKLKMKKKSILIVEKKEEVEVIIKFLIKANLLKKGIHYKIV